MGRDIDRVKFFTKKTSHFPLAREWYRGYIRSQSPLRETLRGMKQLFALLKLPPPPPKVLIPVRQHMLEKYGKDIMLCPKCEKSKLELVATYRKGVLCKTYETSEQETNNKSP